MKFRQCFDSANDGSGTLSSLTMCLCCNKQRLLPYKRPVIVNNSYRPLFFSDALNQALKAFLIFWSVLYCDKAYTAQMVAGSQPNRVICKIKHISPAIGRPMVKNVNHGKNNAINNLIVRLSLSYYSSDIIA